MRKLKRMRNTGKQAQNIVKSKSRWKITLILIIFS